MDKVVVWDSDGSGGVDERLHSLVGGTLPYEARKVLPGDSTGGGDATCRAGS